MIIVPKVGFSEMKKKCKTIYVYYSLWNSLLLEKKITFSVMPQISKNEAGNMCVLELHTVIVTTFITTGGIFQGSEC